MTKRVWVKCWVSAAALLSTLALPSVSRAESPPIIDATFSPPVRSACVDSSECLSDQYCRAGLCAVCGDPATSCTTTSDCGPTCLGVVCQEGRCVRTVRERVDPDAGDGSLDARPLGFAAPMPSEPGCGGARVAPARGGEDGAAIFVALTALIAFVATESKRGRRDAR